MEPAQVLKRLIHTQALSTPCPACHFLSTFILKPLSHWDVHRSGGICQSSTERRTAKRDQQNAHCRKQQKSNPRATFLLEKVFLGSSPLLRVWLLAPQYHKAMIFPTHKSVSLGVGSDSQLNGNFIKHSTVEHKEQSQAAFPSTAPCSLPAFWLRKPGMQQQNNQIPSEKPTAKVGAALKGEVMGISLLRKTPPARRPGLDFSIRLINSVQSWSQGFPLSVWHTQWGKISTASGSRQIPTPTPSHWTRRSGNQSLNGKMTVVHSGLFPIQQYNNC